MKINIIRQVWRSILLHSPLVCHACRHAHFPYGFSSKRETARSLYWLLIWSAEMLKFGDAPWTRDRVKILQSPYPFLPAASSTTPTYGILCSPEFHSHQETKMAARRTQQSTFTISRKNRGLWIVYEAGHLLPNALKKTCLTFLLLQC